mmetsp:Transcript_37264/g.79153  ORF Transcript_37264/g.79153 Transcript_37264/m.79153 type:complete len:217 (-) Transcript_37264:43-693(-)
MLPLGMGSPVMGQPTQEMLAKFGCVKWCVFATYACAFGRFFADDPFGGLNDLFGGLFGTFLLREDPQLQGCYRVLHESPLGAMSDGGLSCLMPYMFMAALNGIFSAVRVYTIVLRFGTLLPCTTRFVCLLPCWLCLSASAQLLAVVFCWKVYKLMQVQALTGIYAHPGDASAHGHSSGPAEHASGGGAADPNSSVSANPLMNTSFTPFQGTGHQLA